MQAVRLWQWDLDAPGAGGNADRALLSHAERTRADRYLVPHAARRFTAGRAAMRRTLASLTGAEPADLVFTETPNGKPLLPAGPHFNLSHSGPVALFAVAAFPVGVDVEALRPLESGLASLVFARSEQAFLHTLPPQSRTAAFFRGWTRKEAVIKAQGGSIADLQQVIVLPSLSGPWQAIDLPAIPGYAAAIAASGHDWKPVWDAA